MNEIDARSLWARVVEEVKQRTTMPAFWRALEASRGITIDGDAFVVGFAPPDYPQASLLKSSENRNVIERVLRDLLGRQVTLKLIQGQTLADYQYVKRMEEAAEATRQRLLRQKYEEGRAAMIWDEIGDQVQRRYAAIGKLRNLPQVRARFLKEAFQTISDAMDEIYPDQPDELTERAAARVFEKLAMLVEVPATLLAYELFRFRESRKS